MNTPEYVQVRTPDKIDIAHLVNIAKGPDRTMAQFADECQISASTLSRIVNGKTTKPLAYDTILKIYNSRASRDDEFLLKALVQANGMRPKEEHERSLSNFSTYARRNQMLSKETAMKNIVVTELFDRGIPVVNATRHTFGMDVDTTAYEIFPGRIGDMAITLDDNYPFKKVWAFYWFPQEPESDDSRKITAQQIVRRTIDAVSSLFLVDAWQPDVIEGLKTSFVFVNPDVFERFLTTLKDAKLNTEMSAILLDIQAGSVSTECWLPGKFSSTKESIFSMPKVDALPDPTEDYDCLDLLKENR